MDTSALRLGIAIPHRNGECHISLVRTMVSADIRGIQTSIFDNSSSLVSENRNILVQQFLDHPFKGTHLFFLDTDMGVPADGIRKLLEADKPIISGLYVDKKFGLFVARRRLSRYRYTPVQEQWSKYSIPGKGAPWVLKEELRDKVLECDAAGAGCLLIRREVLEKVSYPWFFEDYDTASTRHGRESMVSEDFSFFYKAAQAGFRAYVHTGVLCVHWLGSLRFPPSWKEDETLQ